MKRTAVDKRKGSVTRYWSNSRAPSMDGKCSFHLPIYSSILSLIIVLNSYDLYARLANTCQRNRETERRRRTREWRQQEVVNVMRHVFARMQLDRLCAARSVSVLCFRVDVCLFRFSIPNKTDRCVPDQQLIAIIMKISIKNRFGCKNGCKIKILNSYQSERISLSNN